jgi:ligand-binding sensor protein
MADKGRIPALKVGNQWRFPRQQVETWLKTQGSTVARMEESASAQPTSDVRTLLPLACVQKIQDTFADALGVMMVITDLEGQPVTQPSNPCGLYTATTSSPAAHKQCLEVWAQLARAPSLQPVFVPSHLGLLCARGLVRVGSELKAMVVVGGVAPQEWPPNETKLQQIASSLDLEPGLVRQHINEVFILEPQAQKRILTFVQAIADIVAHIITERNQLFAKLQNIAELTKFL